MADNAEANKNNPSAPENEGGLLQGVFNLGLNIVGEGIETLDRGLNLLSLSAMKEHFIAISDAQKKLDQYARAPISEFDILRNEIETSRRFDLVIHELDTINTELTFIHGKNIRFNSVFLASAKEKIHTYLEKFQMPSYKKYDQAAQWLKQQSESSKVVKKITRWTGLDGSIAMSMQLRQIQSSLVTIDNTLTALTDPNLPPEKFSNNPTLNRIATDENNQLDPNITFWEAIIRGFLKK
ncbi:hypothetical protein HYV57_05000 [Candidatus Peregrinibacteria bacterium]|nr:hypothetical protein [Candidatus Peregrinibacteria bacterium]